MMSRFRLLLALAFSACAAVAYADPPGRIARLNLAAGAVSLAPAEAPDQWMQAVLNRPLTSGDRLWAGSEARAELHVGSTALRLAPFTSVEVLNLDDNTLQMKLAQGTINLRVRDLQQDEMVELATPSAAILIRQAGSYRITSDPQNDVTRVWVRFGQAQVITPTQTVTVPSGQSAVISMRSGIAFEVAAYDGDEFDRWSAERDHREDRVVATRYVSREMTGYEDLDPYGTWRSVPEYGDVWVPTHVGSAWAPYREGHWVWMSPWGWTWIDDAPWGFAPFHYGRWVSLDGRWGWAPGPLVRRPVYAPALVAFVGGAHVGASARGGPAVGWFPLGWREPYIPWYRASRTHVHKVNVAHVGNATHAYDGAHVSYVNRWRRDAVTLVPQQVFISARPVAQSSVTLTQAQLERAELFRERSPAAPTRASVAFERAGERPPPEVASRQVISLSPPASPPGRERPALDPRAPGFARTPDSEQRVIVLGRDRLDPGGAEARVPSAVRPTQRRSQSDADAQHAYGRGAVRATEPLPAGPPATPTVGVQPSGVPAVSPRTPSAVAPRPSPQQPRVVILAPDGQPLAAGAAAPGRPSDPRPGAPPRVIVESAGGPPAASRAAVQAPSAPAQQIIVGPHSNAVSAREPLRHQAPPTTHGEAGAPRPPAAMSARQDVGPRVHAPQHDTIRPSRGPEAQGTRDTQPRVFVVPR